MPFQRSSVQVRSSSESIGRPSAAANSEMRQIRRPCLFADCIGLLKGDSLTLSTNLDQTSV